LLFFRQAHLSDLGLTLRRAVRLQLPKDPAHKLQQGVPRAAHSVQPSQGKKRSRHGASAVVTSVMAVTFRLPTSAVLMAMAAAMVVRWYR